MNHIIDFGILKCTHCNFPNFYIAEFSLNQYIYKTLLEYLIAHRGMNYAYIICLGFNQIILEL